jgi:drug/metabolite transporter (DMT)-like permease
MRQPERQGEELGMPDAHPISRSMSPLEWALLLTLSVLWGGSFFFVAIAIRELPPITLVVLRVGLAALALQAVIRIMGLRLPISRGVWAAFLVMGLLNNAIPFGLIAWGQTQVASGIASIFNATTPLFTAILAHMMTDDEKLTRNCVLGVVVGFVGVAVMFGGTALRTAGSGALAQVAMLAAAVAYAFAGVFGRRFRALGVPPLVTAAGQVIASTVILLPVMLMVDRPWTLPWPSASACAAVVGLALLSTALAYIIYFRILATAGALNILLVTFLIPVSAILLGAIVLGETLQPRHLVGMGLIWLGLIAVDGRLWAALARLAHRRS